MKVYAYPHKPCVYLRFRRTILQNVFGILVGSPQTLHLFTEIGTKLAYKIPY